jgi:hypothetical protein
LNLFGLGYYLWKVWLVEDGDPGAIADKAAAAGFTHVLIKIANGIYPYNTTPANSREYVTPLVAALHARGILAYGWHYVFGENPAAEAAIAVRRVHETGVDGYVVDAETEYKNRANQARAFMAALRAGLPGFPVALSTFRFPVYHMEFPFAEFLRGCNVNMPQVYWEQSHNAASQLAECKRQYDALYISKGIQPLPFIPTGAAYRWEGWEPSEADVVAFLEQAKAMGLAGANWWEWWCTHARVPHLWETIVAHNPWGAPPPPPPPPPPPAASMRAMVITETLNLRMGPGIAFAITGRAIRGQYFDVHAIQYDAAGNEWLRISENAWCASTYGGSRLTRLVYPVN